MPSRAASGPPREMQARDLVGSSEASMRVSRYFAPHSAQENATGCCIQFCPPLVLLHSQRRAARYRSGSAERARRLELNGTDQHPVIVFYGYVGRTAILIAALERLDQYSGEVARAVIGRQIRRTDFFAARPSDFKDIRGHRGACSSPKPSLVCLSTHSICRRSTKNSRPKIQGARPHANGPVPGFQGRRDLHYSSSSPKTFPVLGSTRWTRVQMRQVTGSNCSVPLSVGSPATQP